MLEKLTKEQLACSFHESRVLAHGVQISLRRNLAAFPFTMKCSLEERKAIAEKVRDAVLATNLMQGADFYWVDKMEQLDKEFLAERFLLPRNFIASSYGSAFIVNSKRNISIMINNNEHIEMNFLIPLKDLDQSWAIIDAFDSELEKTLQYAFRSKYGYLTSNIKQAGNGLDLKALVFIPALAFNKKTGSDRSALSKMNLRWIKGAGKKVLKYVYSLECSKNVGQSPEDAIGNFRKLALELIEKEEKEENILSHLGSERLEDIAGRAYGIIKYGKRLGDSEAIDLLSYIELACRTKHIKGIKLDNIWQLLIEIQPAHLQKKSNISDAKKQAIERLKIIQERLEIKDTEIN